MTAGAEDWRSSSRRVLVELVVELVLVLALPGHGPTVAAAIARASATGRDVVNAEYAGPALERHHVGRDRAGQALVLAAAAGELAEEALARGADHDRPADRDDLVEAPQQLEVVLDGLAEADARVEPDALLGHPLGRPRTRAAPRGTRAPRRPRRRSAAPPASCAARRACGRGSSRRRRPATTPASSGREAERGHVVHERGARRERRLGHLALGRVDRDPVARGGEALDHRERRARSSSSAGTGSAPGRVDAPPTSRIAAPSAASCRPCSTAASGSRNSPPSGERVGRDVDDAHDRVRAHGAEVCAPREPRPRRRLYQGRPREESHAGRLATRGAATALLRLGRGGRGLRDGRAGPAAGRARHRRPGSSSTILQHGRTPLDGRRPAGDRRRADRRAGCSPPAPTGPSRACTGPRSSSRRRHLALRRGRRVQFDAHLPARPRGRT